MGIIEFIIIAVVLGLIVYLVNTLLPLPPQVQTIILVAVVLVLLLMLLRMFNVVGAIRMP